MIVLFKYCFLSLTASYMFIYTVSCSNGSNNNDQTTPTETAKQKNHTPPAKQKNRMTSDTDVIYIIRDKQQKKRILYIDNNNKTPLLTLMSPETFCLKIKKSDFNNIQKIGLSSNLTEINQLLCSNEQTSKSSNAVPSCEFKSYKITNLYKLEPLNLNDSNTIQLMKQNYKPFCFEFIPW